MKKQQVFIDSSAFVAWFYAHDVFHQHALEQFQKIEQQNLLPCTSSAVIDETATVLSHREGQKAARTFLEFVEQLPMVFISEEMRKEVLHLFIAQSKKGTSIVDCSNVVVMKQLDISSIFTYDRVFSTHFGLSIIL